MDIKRSGSQPSTRGSTEYFTGSVRIDPLFQANHPGRAVGASVTFEPGSRTAWHTHPLGQVLIVTAGLGLVQRWDGPIEEIRSGDVLYIPLGEKHWHGAAATMAFRTWVSSMFGAVKPDSSVSPVADTKTVLT